MKTKFKMTILQAYALHGSVSYGDISAPRLRDILLGDQPEPSEKPRVGQALMEMPGVSAFDLAAELGMSYQALNDRAMSLCGRPLPS